jgi:aromatic ring-opening dioxygenase LigB subunit
MRMGEEILTGTLEHEALGDEAIQAIVKQLRQQPAILKIFNPIVTVEDFKQAFEGVPEKTASFYSGRGYNHYKSFAEGPNYGLADAQAGICQSHVHTITHRILSGKMETRHRRHLEKIPGAVRYNKLRIIQLLEADLKQVLIVAFARNITRLAKTHEGVISKHQYGACIRHVFHLSSINCS